VKKLDMEVLGWHGYKWYAVVERLMVDKWTSNLATALVDIPAVSMPIAHSLKSAHFTVALSPAQGVIIMLFNQPLWGGWIILANNKCSLTGM
jgi:hypothetical protein